MFKNTIILSTIFCLFIFPALVSAEEIKPDPILKESLQKKMVESKEIEAGLRPVEELSADILKGYIISPMIRSVASYIEDGWDLQKAGSIITTTLKYLQGRFPFVPAVEISIAYLALHDIAILEGDIDKANEYFQKAFKNIQDGQKYYSEITESPFATFNFAISHFLLKNVFENVFENGVTVFDLKEALKSLTGYYVFRSRIYGINLAKKGWVEAIANWQVDDYKTSTQDSSKLIDFSTASRSS